MTEEKDRGWEREEDGERGDLGKEGDKESGRRGRKEEERWKKRREDGQ